MTAPDGGAGPNPTSVDRPRRVFSRFYAAMSKRMDDEGLRDLRTELLADLTGTVVAIGAGNGRNFACYPATVTRVHAIEPEPHLRSLATVAAAAAMYRSPCMPPSPKTCRCPKPARTPCCSAWSCPPSRTGPPRSPRPDAYSARPAPCGPPSTPSPPPGACAPRNALPTPPCGR